MPVSGHVIHRVTVGSFSQSLGSTSGFTIVAEREPNPDRVTVPRPEVDPGSEAQIDNDYLSRWFDPVEDRLRKVWRSSFSTASRTGSFPTAWRQPTGRSGVSSRRTEDGPGYVPLWHTPIRDPGWST